jgi:hypothetical protein
LKASVGDMYWELLILLCQLLYIFGLYLLFGKGNPDKLEEY